MIESSTLTDAAERILRTAAAHQKAEAARNMAAAWRRGDIQAVGIGDPPDRPARPASPKLTRPGDMPCRRINRGTKGRIALLHALAHIELNAIDLAADIITRFAGTADLPRAFSDDWVGVADDEARHFRMLTDRLSNFDAAYGDLPAHDGLWEAATDTANDLLARLAVVPMVLEARGLDVTPAMIEKLEAVDDPESAAVLRVVLEEEIRHVGIGRHWFEFLCAQEGRPPVETFQTLVRRHFKGQVKAPFNLESRTAAGFDAAYYVPLAGG